MYLISSSKTTILSKFPNLETAFTYPHKNEGTNDFQFFSQMKFFAKVNANYGMELLRIKPTADKRMEISHVRKMHINNLNCLACPKQHYDMVAVGLANGEVKLLNYKNFQYIHTFPSENFHNSAIFLDYNCSDEFLLSVDEKGKINVFGIKTKTKMHLINVDSNSTLSRFHPSKRYQLATASFKGSVHVYDIHSKRFIFSSRDCHAAPCKDLSMTAALPDALISVGYDSIINVFDVKHKTPVHQIVYEHPLSSVAASSCGTAFAVGSLRGELILFDMRNTKSSLASKRVHESAVSRVAFVPNVDENFVPSCSNYENSSNSILLSKEKRKSVAAKNENPLKKQDWFSDFFDLNTDKKNEKLSKNLLCRRDSFDWDALNRKHTLDDYRSSLLLNYRTSSYVCQLAAGPHIELNSPVDTTVVSLGISSDFVNTKSRKKSVSATYLSNNSNASLTLDKKLKQIQAVDSKRIYADDGIVKESSSMDNELRYHFLKLSDENSTPNPFDLNSREMLFHESAYHFLLEEIQKFRLEVKDRVHKLEQELKFTLETTKWHIFTQNHNLWMKNVKCAEEIREIISALFQTDTFIQDYARLKKENEDLKEKLRLKYNEQ